MREGSERLLKAADRFSVGSTRGSLRTRPTEVVDGLVPDLATEGMMGEAIDVLGQPIGIKLFDCLHDPGVNGPSAVFKEARIGDFLSQRMFE